MKKTFEQIAKEDSRYDVKAIKFVFDGLGATIQKIREDIEETFGIRSVLEGYAAHLAAVKHEAQELEKLDQKIEEFQKALDRKKMDLLPAINTEFHDLLYGLSKSPKLINMINGLKDQIYRYREMILKESKYASTSNLDHKRMLKYLIWVYWHVKPSYTCI